MAKAKTNLDTSGNPTVIRNCICEHEYQDKRYGYRRRVHNVGKKSGKRRCTVCGSEN